MTCLTRWAEAWEYSGFWCIGSLLMGEDRSGGGPNAALSDTQASFISAGVEANKGMILYNLTTGDSGPVTAVTMTTLTATGVTWTDGDQYRLAILTGNQIATIEHLLTITASDVSAALQASGQCDCTIGAVGLGLAKKLNIVEAGLFYSCPCGASPDLSEEERSALLVWMTNNLDNIRMGNLELCDGFTGAEFPAFGIAEQSWTEFAANQIVVNRVHRSGSI